jgi:hypothetical protein
MTIDLLEKAEANGPAKSHPIRADQFEVVPPGPLIDDAGAEVDVVAVTIEHEPQFGQRTREFPRDSFCASSVHLAKVGNHAVIA